MCKPYRLRLGKLERRILLALTEHEHLTFGQLTRRTVTSGAKLATHKTAVSRAVWSLNEKELVEVWSLVWASGTRKDDDDATLQTWTQDGRALSWHGGKHPRIREVEITSDGAEAVRGSDD